MDRPGLRYAHGAGVDPESWFLCDIFYFQFQLGHRLNLNSDILNYLYTKTNYPRKPAQIHKSAATGPPKCFKHKNGNVVFTRVRSSREKTVLPGKPIASKQVAGVLPLM